MKEEMKDEEILRKAIEKAVKNGYEDEYNTKGNQYHPYCYAVIFSHEFAKAFWGEEQLLFEGDGVGERICLHCGVDTAYQPKKETGCNHVHYPEACKFCSDKLKDWKHHLGIMVLEERPLQYIARFL